MVTVNVRKGLLLVVAVLAVLCASSAYGAALWTDGFESGDYSNGWDNYPGIGPIEIGTLAYGVTPRSGDYLAYSHLNYVGSTA